MKHEDLWGLGEIALGYATNGLDDTWNQAYTLARLQTLQTIALYERDWHTFDAIGVWLDLWYNVPQRTHAFEAQKQ